METECCWFPHDGPVPRDLSTAHPKIRRCLDYWQAIRPSGGGLPARRDLDPIAVPHLLPHLWLLDVEDAPRRYRYRLVGGSMVDAGLGVKRGDYFDETVRSEDLPGLLAILDRISEQRVIDWRRGPPALEHDRFVSRLERILMPLAADGDNVDIILGCTVFYWSDGRAD